MMEGNERMFSRDRPAVAGSSTAASGMLRAVACDRRGGRHRGVSAHSADSQESGQVVPLERAHAHNDYEHERPLYDALDHGFKSVEADIWLIDGELVVSHDDPRLPTTEEPQGTLESLYLKPLGGG